MSAQALVGLVLVMLGVILLVAQQTGVGGEVIPLLIGAGFLVAYLTTRNYGLLIPGGILAGLGTGIVVASAGGPQSGPVLGLGVGFLAIAAIDRLVGGEREAQWWPLIPGGILAVAGAIATPAFQSLARYLLPAALIVVGAWLLSGHLRHRGGRPTGDRSPSGSE